MSRPNSDDLKQKQLYLLEVLVKTVEITSDESPADQVRPLFVRVKFLDFPHLEITRRDFLKQKEKDVDHNLVELTDSFDANFADIDEVPSKKQGSKDLEHEQEAAVSDGVAPKEETPPEDPSTFNVGKSCMFPMLPLQLIKQIQRYPIVIQIFRRNQEDEYDLVGGARVRLGPDFEDLIIEAGEENTQLPVSNLLESELPVKDIFGVPIGKMSIFIRLSCYGVTIVNQFQLIGENGEYMFRNDRKDNTLEAQKKRSFIFGNEPYATASVLGRLVHASDVRNLKPIVTTEENMLPIMGSEPCEEGAQDGSSAPPWKNCGGRSKFITRAGEFKGIDVKFWFDRGNCPRDSPVLFPYPFSQFGNKHVDESAMNADAVADVETSTLFDVPKSKDFLPNNVSGREGQKTTCCDNCCDAKEHKKDDARSDKHLAVELPHTTNELKLQKFSNDYFNLISWIKSLILSENFADVMDAESWIQLLLVLKDSFTHFGPDLGSGRKYKKPETEYNTMKDQHHVELPYPSTSNGRSAGNYQISKFNSNQHSKFVCDGNSFKEKDGEQCYSANMNKKSKEALTTANFLSSTPCQMNGAGNLTNNNHIAGKFVGVPNIRKTVDSNAPTGIKQKDNQIEKQLNGIGEKILERKSSAVIIKVDESGFNEERATKDLEIPNVRASVKTQRVKSDSETSKSTRAKPKRKDSADLFRDSKGNFVNKKTPKEESKPDSQSRRMRRKYLSIYKYTDGMYPGVNVGHRHCSLLSRNVPKSMGWLWNTSDSGDGLKKRRGWKPGAINKTIANMIKMTKVAAGIEVAVEVEKPKGPKTVRKGRRPISAISGATSTNVTRDDDDDSYDCSPLPPTLHVHKKDGVYFISMNPLRLEDDDDEQVPLMFKIDADPSTSSSESSLEIECTAPGALRRRQIKPPPVYQDKQTATEDV